MIELPTVLILGAGASMEFNYPSGVELKDKVIELTHPPSSQANRCLLSLNFHQQIINEFRNALQYSGKSSVDAFLENRQEYIGVGKASIALALIQHEVTNTLFKDSKSWYGYLFERMASEFADFSENQIGIVTFNYDRSLETFLFNALKNSYGKSEDEVSKTLKRIPIFHVHGKLGDLPWESSNGRPYKRTYEQNLIEYSANCIKIISEEEHIEESFGLAREFIRSSTRVIFLGFGYLRENLDRLNLDVGQHSKHQFLGTSYGLTQLESQEIEKLFNSRLRLRDTDKKVLQFLRERVTL